MYIYNRQENIIKIDIVQRLNRLINRSKVNFPLNKPNLLEPDFKGHSFNSYLTQTKSQKNKKNLLSGTTRVPIVGSQQAASDGIF